MKKLLLLAALVPVVTFGQITITDANLPQANEEHIMSTLIDPTVDYLSTGANYTWDFSNLTPSGQRFSSFHPMSQASQLSLILFGSFAPTAYKASYFSPTTDLPLDELTANFPMTIDEISQFSKLTPTYLNLVGYEFILNGQGLPVRSDTIETRYELPLNYGNSYTSRGYTHMDMNPIYNAQWIQHRYRESQVDGWGTVMTPYGTFNALRIHHRVEETDSIFFAIDTTGTWIPLPIPEAHEYEWRALEEKEAVMRIRTSVVMGTETVTGIEYRDEYNGLGLGEQELQFAVYPNPASGQVFVQATDIINRIQVLDQRGRIVQTIDGNNLQVAVSDVSGLDAGLYYIVVSTEKGKGTQLFVKN